MNSTPAWLRKAIREEKRAASPISDFDYKRSSFDGMPTHQLMRLGEPDDARPKLCPRPRKVEKTFTPRHMEEGPAWAVSDRATGMCLFQVRGSYVHAMREANRFTSGAAETLFIGRSGGSAPYVMGDPPRGAGRRDPRQVIPAPVFT